MKALQILASWKLAPDPGTYELLYMYLGGTDPALVSSVRSLLRNRKGLSEKDVRRLRNRHFRDERAGAKVGEIGEKLRDEIGHAAAIIQTAIEVRSEILGRLKQSRSHLGLSLDGRSLHQIVTSASSIAHKLRMEDLYLSSSLKQSLDDIVRLQQDLTALDTESLIDPLTGIANHKRFNARLSEDLAAARAHGKPFSLLMADVDKFAKFNEFHGHITGNEVLKLIAQTLRQRVREQDLVARYEGDAFAVILADTPLPKAISIADVLLRAVAANHLQRRSSGEKMGHVTISIGVVRANGEEPEQSIIENARVCLIEAKKAGRNCVHAERKPVSLSTAAQG